MKWKIGILAVLFVLFFMGTASAALPFIFNRPVIVNDYLQAQSISIGRAPNISSELLDVYSKGDDAQVQVKSGAKSSIVSTDRYSISYKSGFVWRSEGLGRYMGWMPANSNDLVFTATVPDIYEAAIRIKPDNRVEFDKQVTANLGYSTTNYTGLSGRYVKTYDGLGGNEQLCLVDGGIITEQCS